MKRQFVAALSAAAALTAASATAGPAVADAPRAHASARYTVKLVDSVFRPSSIRARGSATLTFVWAGKLTHNIIGPKIPNSYATPRKRALPLTRTYRKGSYSFYCSIHPGMTLKLRVR